jgi:hypothetical protein
MESNKEATWNIVSIEEIVYIVLHTNPNIWHSAGIIVVLL